MTADTLVLDARGVTVRFGGITAVSSVDLQVQRGELVGLLGPNGAGKTTLFEVLSGFLPPSSGSVWLEGRDITSLPVHKRTARGLSRGFQDARLFPAMSVLDVLTLAQERRVRGRTDLLSELLRGPAARRCERLARARAAESIERFGLQRYRDAAVAELSTGTRRVVEIAAVLSQEPTVLLLDEPTAGITTKETEALAELLGDIRKASGVTMLLIEHDVPMVMGLADRVYVMEAGAVLTSGLPADVVADERVVRAYFGGALPDGLAA